MRERPHADRSRDEKPIHLRDPKSKTLILLSITVSSILWTVIAFSALPFQSLPLYFVHQYNSSLFLLRVCMLCVYVIWVDFLLATKGFQVRFASIISPMMTVPFQDGNFVLVRGLGTRTKRWGFCDLESWHYAHLSLMLPELLLCFHSLHWAKIDSIIDFLLGGVWVPIWDGVSKILTGSPEGWTGSKIPPHTIGQDLFSPSLKGVNLTFNGSLRLPYSATCNWDTKGFEGEQPTDSIWGLPNGALGPSWHHSLSLLHSAWSVELYYCSRCSLILKLTEPTERVENSPTCQLYDFGKIENSMLRFPHLWNDSTCIYLIGLWRELS